MNPTSTIRKLALSFALALFSVQAVAGPAFFAVVPVSAPGAAVTTPLTLAQEPLPSAWAGESYAFDFKPLLSQQGENPKITTAGASWSLVSGSLPGGLTFGSDGVLTGIPMASAPATDFTVQATESGQSVRTLYSINVSAVALAGSTLQGGWVGSPYSADLSSYFTLDGTTLGPAAWSLAAGDLPAGLSLSTAGVISGSPSGAPAPANFTLQASFDGHAAQAAYELTIAAPQLALAAASLPSAALANPYQFNFAPLLTVTGPSDANPQEATWRIAQGTLPAGLALSSQGLLSGTPTESTSTTTFTIEASYRGAVIQRIYQLPPVQGFTVAAATLPTGEQGYAYQFDFKPLVSVGGAQASSALLQNLSWSVAGGALPAGLSLSAAGVLSGTPSQVITSSVTVRAQYGTASSQQTFSINVPAKEYGGYTMNTMFFSRGESNGTCWAKWNWGGGAVTNAGHTTSSISDCYVDYGGYRYRPYGGLQAVYNDSYQNYDYYAVSRQPY